jgi:hypothetical protein
MPVLGLKKAALFETRIVRLAFLQKMARARLQLCDKTCRMGGRSAALHFS